MRTKSGIYKVQNPERYKGNADGVVFRSGWEEWAFKWCDNNKDILKWSSEEVVVPYVYEVDNRFHRYFMDLYIEFANGTKLLVEIKPAAQTRPPKKKGKKTTKRYLNEGLTYIKNQNKWKAADRFATKRGWKFVIWTEKELTEMGIMPKMYNGAINKNKPKPIKPLPKFKKGPKKKNK